MVAVVLAVVVASALNTWLWPTPFPIQGNDVCRSLANRLESHLDVTSVPLKRGDCRSLQTQDENAYTHTAIIKRTSEQGGHH